MVVGSSTDEGLEPTGLVDEALYFACGLWRLGVRCEVCLDDTLFLECKLWRHGVRGEGRGKSKAKKGELSQTHNHSAKQEFALGLPDFAVTLSQTREPSKCRYAFCGLSDKADECLKAEADKVEKTLRVDPQPQQSRSGADSSQSRKPQRQRGKEMTEPECDQQPRASADPPQPRKPQKQQRWEMAEVECADRTEAIKKMEHVARLLIDFC